MGRHRKANWDDPYFAPGLKARRRAAGTAWYWLPRPEDIAAGYPLKSRPLPGGDDDDAVRERARLCRAYWRELQEWRAGGETPKPRHAPGTWQAVIERYESDEFSPFQQLRANTRENYAGYHRIVERAIGKRQVRATTGEDLQRWHRGFRAGALKRGQQGWVQAKHCMGAIRRLARYAVIIGHISPQEGANIRELFESISFKGGSARTKQPTWQQVRDFVRTADAHGRPSIGTAVLMTFELARRRIEVIGRYEKIGPGDPGGGIVWNGKRWTGGILWSDIGADWILEFRDSKHPDKDPAQFNLTLYPELLERLEAVPKAQRVGPLIVSETSGRPYSEEQFRKEFNKIRDGAGWPKDIWSMDCRAGGATEIGDAVADTGIKDKATAERMIESHTLHTTPSMAKRYARPTAATFETVAKLRRERRERQG